eukprot:7135405-Prymnesium_polylepis.1
MRAQPLPAAVTAAPLPHPVNLSAPRPPAALLAQTGALRPSHSRPRPPAFGRPPSRAVTAKIGTWRRASSRHGSCTRRASRTL